MRKSLLFYPERVDDCTIWQSVRIGEERKCFSQNVVVSINVMWFYIYIDRQSTNVQNFGTICWFWPWFISSRSRLLFHKLLQRYCNLELDIISFLWCLGLTLIFINFRTSIQGKEMIVTFCISQRGQSKDCVAQV